MGADSVLAPEPTFSAGDLGLNACNQEVACDADACIGEGHVGEPGSCDTSCCHRSIRRGQE